MNNELDFLDHEQNLNGDSLQKLSELVNEYESLEIQIFQMENDLKKLKDSLQEISRSSIPSLLNEVGISDIKLINGKKVIVQEKLHASFKKDLIESVLNEMISLEQDPESMRAVQEMFKQKLIISNFDDEMVQKILDLEIPYDIDKSIHYQTLNKYCRNRIESGLPVPESINVYQYQETTIK